MVRKLHVGCGQCILPGYVNIDIMSWRGIDIMADLQTLPVADASIDLIYSASVLEHISRMDWVTVLRQWLLKLRPGGIVRISVPDFEAAAIRYIVTGNLDELLGLLIGGQKDAYDWHGMIFDYHILAEGLVRAGFVDIHRYDWRQTDIGKLGIDDLSQAYLPHMDKEYGQHMMVNVEAMRPYERAIS